MKKIFYFIGIALILLLFMNCSEYQDWSDHGPMKDNIPPGPVSSPSVENIHGGAIITYNLPTDNDIIGVKAVYSFKEGKDEELREAYSSAYSDTILLEGFPDTSERTVKLICIDKSKNESDPVSVIIKPLTPPVDLVFLSIEMSQAFGGILVQWENTEQATVGISLFYEDSVGNMVLNYTYYSNQPEENYTFRGFKDVETKFMIQIQDRWGNLSASKETIITPLFEIPLLANDEAGWVWERYGYDDRSCVWRGDLTDTYHPNYNFYKIFDGSTTTWLHSGKGSVLGNYTEKPEDMEIVVKPFYLTIDLKRLVNFSRHIYYMRNTKEFDLAQLKHYEIWGTNEKPKGYDDFEDKWESLEYWTSWPEVNGTDAWKNDWDQIFDCPLYPPSGHRLLNEITPEDKEWARNGFDFEVIPEYSSKPYRYIRIVCDKIFTGTPQEFMAVGVIVEMEFFGAYYD